MPGPRNPLDGGGSIQGQPNKTIKPVVPDCEGGQFMDSPSGGIVSADSNYLTVSRDQYWNEITQDRPMHAEATPGHSNPTYTGKQYSEDWNGGYSNYGVTVNPPAASRDGVTVKGDAADRGKDS